MKIDRKKFWQNYHRSFDAYGPTTQATVNALNDILDRFEVEKRLKYRSWFAYSLATSFHETGIGGNHFVPVKEGRERADSPRRANQDRYWKTGFYGRGQIQTTHEENYRKLSRDLGQGDAFVQNPDLLLTPKWSYESLIYGMTKGIYRGDAKGRKNLARYLKDDDASLQDYVNARDIVNGDIRKNGLLIAGYAEKFEHILKDSTVMASPQMMSVSSADDSNTSSQEPTEPAPSSNGTNIGSQEAEVIANVGTTSTEAEKRIEGATALDTTHVKATEKTGFLSKIAVVISGIFTGTYVIPQGLAEGLNIWEIFKMIGAFLYEFRFWIGGALAVWFIVTKWESVTLKKKQIDVNTDPEKGDVVLHKHKGWIQRFRDAIKTFRNRHVEE